MKRKKVLLTNPIHPKGMQILQETAEAVVVPDNIPSTLYKAVADAAALIVRTPLPADIVKYAEKLQIIVRHGVGLDFIPVEDATARGILVANTPEANTEAVAEHVIGILLMLARQFSRLNLRMHQGDWNCRQQITGMELQGKTVGVVGLGRIGRRVASICQTAFAIKVLGYDPYIESLPDEVKKVSLRTLFQESDFVTIHAPLTPETYRMVDSKLLSLMKPTAFLVNTSRGPLVDEIELSKVLTAGRIAGAALDVFDVEPLRDDHPILSFENVILTPHSAALTKESMERMGVESAREVTRALKGERPLNLVNPQVLKMLHEKYHQ